MDERFQAAVLPPADRGPCRWIQLHRGLLRRPPDPPDHHQRDLQEATPLCVTPPTAAPQTVRVPSCVPGSSGVNPEKKGTFPGVALEECRRRPSDGSAGGAAVRRATLNKGQADVRTQPFRDATFAQSLSGRRRQRRNKGILIFNGDGAG